MGDSMSNSNTKTLFDYFNRLFYLFNIINPSEKLFFLAALPTPDLVIMSTNSANLSSNVKKWLSENR